MTDTRGTAVLNKLFHGYAPFKGEMIGRRNGVLISTDLGEAVAYAMWNLEDRGPMMIEPGWKVYRGMDRGRAHPRQRPRGQRPQGQEAHQHPHPLQGRGRCGSPRPIRMTLEKAMAYIQDDELVEVTPKSIRLRKKFLDPNERKKEVKRVEATRHSGATIYTRRFNAQHALLLPARGERNTPSAL